MSVLQEQAVQMISGLSDDNVSFLIEVIRRLMPQGTSVAEPQSEKTAAASALRRLNIARAEIRQYLPDDFDPERELEEARAAGQMCEDRQG